jgi:LasA protease
MKQLVSALTALALTLTACATEPSLWGVYSTPTAPIPTVTVPVTATVPPPTPTAITIFTDPRPTGLPTAAFPFTPTFNIPSPVAEKSSTPESSNEPILYYAQSGDTLDALAARFGVGAQEITSPKTIPGSTLIDAGTLLIIPDRIDKETSPDVQILPDSEIVYSATAANFNSDQFIVNAGGHLSAYREYLGSTGWTTGVQAMKRLADENSVNPRLLLAVLEYESHWVYSAPATTLGEEYPMGFQSLKYKGLFMQMVWAVNQLFNGYYGWRTGTLTELTFPDGETLRLHPELNAGTVAIQYFFSRHHNRAEWAEIVSPDSVNSFYSLYLQIRGATLPTRNNPAQNGFALRTQS